MSNAFGTQAAVKAPESGTETTLWEIDGAHSNASFSIRHMMISNVRGEFTEMSGKVFLDEQDVTRSKLEGTIEVASINTREPDRDNHLKSGDFFDVEEFPRIKFQSKKIDRGTGGQLMIIGDLTIRDVTKEISLAVEEITPQRKDPWGMMRFGASARTQINREDFGLTWNKAIEGGGVLVGEQAKLLIEAEFVKQEG